MKNFFRLGLQMGLFAGSLFVAFAIAGVIVASKETATGEEAEVNQGPLVWAVDIEKRSYDAPIVAYGTARVPKVYAIRSQVSGEVVEIAPNFLEGLEVAKDQPLFKVDPSDIELAIVEAEANLLQIQASIDKIETEISPIDAQVEALRQEEADQRNSLRVRNDAVELARKEVDRLKNLVDRGAASKSQLEAAQQALNQHEQAILLPQSRMSQIPIEIKAREAQKQAIWAQKKVLEAQKKVMEAQIARQRLQMSRTAISSPVHGIVLLREPSSGLSAKQLSAGDVVQPGIDLAWIMPLDEGMEIPVSLDINSALWMRGVEEGIGGGGQISRQVKFEEFIANIPEVEICWYANPTYKWKGRVHRFLSELDVATRSTTFIIHVSNPGSAIIPGKELPLTAGMYCKIEVPSRVHRDAIVIPRSALREGNRVYVAAGDELQVRDIVPSRMTKDSIVVESGLKAGEVLVISDLPQAVPGMKIRTVKKGK